MDLTRFPRVALAHLPTPLEELSRLGRELGLARLLIKRDDCTGLGLGGNKTRKLEFAMAAALDQGADTVITCGGLQSNHVRQTAAAAAKLGLTLHAVLSNPLADAPDAYTRSGNLLLDRAFGATLHVVANDDAAAQAEVARLDEELRAKGSVPYFVPVGASYGIGALGYVECARELVEQCGARGLHPSHVFVTTGSAGTHGGLLAGLRLASSDMSVIGISVSEPAEAKRAKVRAIVGEIAEVLERDVPVRDEEIVVFDDYMGPGYGIPTEAGRAAIQRLARSDGILLDPVYTGKAMAGMLDLLQRGELGEVRDPVFLHTGGSPALFAYPSDP